MKIRAFRWLLPVLAVLILMPNASIQAQTWQPAVFRGTISDYTVASPGGGPWEIRGEWSLVLKGSSGLADFTAAVNMERSDEGVTLNGNDFNNPADRKAHTHHITLRNGTVVMLSNGFKVTGTATITADGAYPPPFGATLPVLTITITGATGQGSVPFSNITVVFGSPASNHFGTNPIHGVVRSVQ